MKTIKSPDHNNVLQSVRILFNKSKYYFKAFIFKVFSINELSNSFYRKLGNLLANFLKRDMDISSWKYRGDLLIKLIEKYDCLKDNNKVFETGTGWFHFYSVYTKIFYNVSITMFDIWDNRQWKVFKTNFKKLTTFNYENEDKTNSVIKFSKTLNDCKNYDELYEKYNLSYLINKNGSISNIQSNSYDLVISFHVLEHIPENSINDVINDFYRILKPGGFCIHQIGCDDHLAHGTTLNPKYFLKYSNRIWSLLFENTVQYTNRLQMSDYLEMFNDKGFKLMEKMPVYTDISNLVVNKQFENYSKDDLKCCELTVVHQK